MREPIEPEQVVAFLHLFESLAAQEDFDLLRDLIHERAFFRFNDGDFVGHEPIRAVFEKTWRGDPSVTRSAFYLTDVVVLCSDTASAAVTYTYHWEGEQAGRPFAVRGRGTRVIVREGEKFRVVHEHLSRFPATV